MLRPVPNNRSPKHEHALTLGYPVEIRYSAASGFVFRIVLDERPTRRLATRGGMWDRLRLRFFDRAALKSAEEELAKCVAAMRASGLGKMLVAPSDAIPELAPPRSVRPEPSRAKQRLALHAPMLVRVA